MSSAITAVVVSGVIAKRGADKAQHALDASTTAQRGIEEQRLAQEQEQYEANVGRYEESVVRSEEKYGARREDLSPYRTAGGNALRGLERLLSGDFNIEEDPGYQFRLQEGYRGLGASQAGRRLGGRAAKEAIRYGQGAASQEYGAGYERKRRTLSDIAGMGINAAGASYGSESTGQITGYGAASAARLSGIEGDYGVNRAGMEGARSAGYQSNISNLSTAWQNYNTPSAPSYSTPLHDQTSDLGW